MWSFLMAPEMICKLLLSFMQADYMFLIYSGVLSPCASVTSGFTVVVQQGTPFPTIQHVCVSMLKLLHFQIPITTNSNCYLFL